MNDKELIIKDQVEVGDCPLHGYITIQDHNGKYLVKKHNMIVNSGREYLLNKAFDNTEETRTIKYIYFGQSENLTEPSMTANDINVTYKYELQSDDEDGNGYFELNSTQNYIIIKTKFINNPSTTETTIKEIGLLFSNYDEDDDDAAKEKNKTALFSRVVHEPITIGPRMSSYTVTYYVYF